jgi:hypothetical protein
MRRVASLGATALIAVACGSVPESRTPESSSSGTVLPSPTVQEQASSEDLEYSCGGSPHTFRPDIFEEPEYRLSSSEAGKVLARFIRRGARGIDLPEEGWHLAGMDDQEASFVVEIPRAPWYNDVQLKTGAQGHWRLSGYGGGCMPMVAITDQNAASWRLAPGQRINSDTTSFRVDVTEWACASGQSNAERLQTPLIFEEAARVVVVFTVTRQDGSFTCIANPSTRVEVHLTQPLGSRPLLDGGTLPWRDARDD